MSGPQFARIKNWSSFQHYKDRSPPWIKLHRSLLDDIDFHCLPIASKALAPMLWLLAAESSDGLVRVDDEFLVFRLRWTAKDIHDAVKPLIDKGFLILASTSLAPCKQDAMPEESRGETEREREGRAKPRRATALPPDFLLTQERRNYALSKDVPNPEKEFEAFRAHHEAHGKVMKSWDAAWHTWCLNAKKFGGREPPRGTGSMGGVLR